ncbi:hypothetical protein [Pseudonocardia oroxyli]|uniref:AraC-binding-like domain-containing protein n=1 Tax=Pseudonocardia oroxyli TaxID=366584 RepID=A0A1G7PZ94_PSEOR|nr:hypothetical protein [Pseudonocardia oroxyli]SDF90690.1 AraC-binding-like domain-containing protein [Pseudonocardia oroxyli]
MTLPLDDPGSPRARAARLLARRHLRRVHPARSLPQPRAADWSREGVAGWVRSRRVFDVNCAEIGTVGQLNIHGPREVGRTSEETVFVNLQLSGSCVGSQGGRTCYVPAGSFALFDATRPFRLDHAEDWPSLSFRVPRERLMGLVRRPDDVTARTHDSHLNRAFRAHRGCGPSDLRPR